MEPASLPLPLGALEEALYNIASSLIADGTKPQFLTPRQILGWSGYARRGAWINREISEAMDKYSLATYPDFESAFIDDHILIGIVPAISNDSSETQDHSITIEDSNTFSASSWVFNDPTHRVSKLEAANREVICVSPNDTLEKCVGLMMAHDFSQLPVVTSPREIKGAVSWKSLGKRLSLGISCKTAADFVDDCPEIYSTASLFDAISLVIEFDFVVVRKPDRTISGIISASDLANQFRFLSEPFLLLGEIENSVRNLIGERISNGDVMRFATTGHYSREINGIFDLDFGQYVAILSSPDIWKSLGIPLDRVTFCAQLDTVRVIRNNVMHFDPDGISPSELRQLQEFTKFLKDLLSIARRIVT